MKPLLAVLVAVLLAPMSLAQTPVPTGRGPATSLFLQVREAGLDRTQIFRVRDVFLDREDLHIKLQDGLVGLATAADGHVTAAYFQGEGVVLLMPPDRVERWSLNVFTGNAVLEESFTTAFLRFNDATAAEIARFGRPADPAEAEAFFNTWNSTVRNLSAVAALRITTTLLNAQRTGPDGAVTYERDPSDRVLLARVLGNRHGIFDLIFDTRQPEQITVGHVAREDGAEWYDLWTSFPMRSVRQARRSAARRSTIVTQESAEAGAKDPVTLNNYKIRARVVPPESIAVEVEFEVTNSLAGERVLRMELARRLRVTEASADGASIEVIQNEALKGSALDRRGNDLVALVFPRALIPGKPVRVRMKYAGEVMSEAGGGLMYVGARGTWFPNRGVAMANFDIEFTYPADWRLVATGKRTSVREDPSAGTVVARYTSERPIPLAGFNLGKWTESRATSTAGEVFVYAGGVETALASNRKSAMVALPDRRTGQIVEQLGGVEAGPQPSANARAVAEKAARDLEWLSARLGAFPFSSLSLTQIPGPDSSSWPGLIYLSSMVLLSEEERREARLGRWGDLVYRHVMTTHELVHQWIGDLVIWRSYREQWIVEALSNYIALLKLEEQNPAVFREVLNHYRDELLKENGKGVKITEAGPVTLGGRLNSSRFPNGFTTISYGRGTWLIHMLRHMLLENSEAQAKGMRRGADEPFFRAMRRLRERFDGKEITTRDLQSIFEEQVPASLRFEGSRSLDWFFDEWVNGTAVPQIELADVKIVGRVARGRIVQKHAPASLITSVPLYTDNKTPALVGRVFAEGEETTFRLAVPAGTRRLTLDPAGTLLRR